jgi:hypothetical protein
MSVTISGTTGVATPGVQNSADETVAGNLTVTGAIQGSGVTTNLYPLVSGTVVPYTSATNTGTTIDFTGIPAWVKRITVIFNQLSLSGSNAFLIQLGYGNTPTIVSTGYVGTGSRMAATVGTASYTAGFGVDTIGTAEAIVGALTINLIDVSTNTWVAYGTFSSAPSVAIAYITNGVIALGAGNTLTTARITRSGSDTIDAGSVNIFYE